MTDIATMCERVPHYSDDPTQPLLFYGGPLSSFDVQYAIVERMSDGGTPGVDPHRVVEMRAWPTREHYFQAYKDLDFDVQEKIRQAPTPGLAKWMGQAGANLVKLRSGWDDGIAYDVMVSGIRLQVEQHAGFAYLLSASRQRFIAEDSPTDRIWGIRDEQKGWTGMNLLGIALMQVRAELADANPSLSLGFRLSSDARRVLAGSETAEWWL